MRFHNYFVYIITNQNKTVLYTGVTNDLQRRIYEHQHGHFPGFTKKYNCHYLLYFEYFENITEAIDREKQIKKYRREKKELLINSLNPEWRFLNEEIMDK